jgi:hypothetical protein
MQTGFPAISVPMGLTHGMLPAGLTFLGPAFSESTLIRYAYDFDWLIGPGKALDPARQFLITPELFGNALLVAQQYAGAFPRTAASRHHHPRQCGSGT